MLSSAASHVDAIVWCRKWTMISGMAHMLLCCVWGLASGMALNYKAFFGAHHQWAHAGELSVAAAFCFPYVRFEKARTYYILFWAFFLAMFTNGAAYAVAALSGDYWLGQPTERMGEPGPDRNFTIWSKLSLLLVPGICAPACLIAFSMFLYGMHRSDGYPITGTDVKKSK